MKLRERPVGPRPLSKGSVAWCEWMLGVAETGLCATEHDVRPLVEAVSQLKEHRAWDKLGTDEPKSWERLVCERLDTLYRRVAWIDALVSGYELLRKRGFRGRVTRKMAEQAAGFPPPGTATIRVDLPSTVRPERHSPSGFAPGVIPPLGNPAAMHVSELLAAFSSAPAAAQIAFLAQLQGAVPAVVATPATPSGIAGNTVTAAAMPAASVPAATNPAASSPSSAAIPVPQTVLSSEIRVEVS